MRLLFSCLLALFLHTTAHTQSNYEVGLRALSIDNFGLILKKERAQGSFLRVRLAFTNLTFTAAAGDASLNLNLGAAIGFEKRQWLTDRLDLLYGPEPFISISSNSGAGISQTALSGGLGYVVGLNYYISDRFSVGLETIPRASFSVTSGGGITVTQFGVGFSSTSFAVVGVYRFMAGETK